MDLGLTDKHVLVTGASRGIGRALALGIAQEGARVSVVARTATELAALVEEMGGEGSGHSATVCDLTEEGAPTVTVRSLLQRTGAIDIVINNLGGNGGVRDVLASADEWYRVWQLNVGIAIEINNIAAPEMVENGWGRILHISSTSGVTYHGAGPYAAAKAYLNAYTAILGRSLASSGVLVNALMSGPVASEHNAWGRAVKENPDHVAAFVNEHVAIGRLGKPEDLVPLALLLASDLNRFSAGAVIPVDGGSM